MCYIPTIEDSTYYSEQLKGRSYYSGIATKSFKICLTLGAKEHHFCAEPGQFYSKFSVYDEKKELLL